MNPDKTLVLITLMSSEASDIPVHASLLCTFSLEIEEDLDQIKQLVHGQISQGDRGSGPTLKNHKNIGFHTNTGPDHLKKHKATKPSFNVGPSSAHQRNTI